MTRPLRPVSSGKGARVKQEPYVDWLAERDSIMRRLEAAHIPTRHTRLYGEQILGNEGWEPFSFDVARKLLAQVEPPSKLDIANARWRE